MLYSHVSRDERVALAAYRRIGMSMRSCAKAMGRSPSTICHELQRPGNQYSVRKAQGNAQARRVAANQRFRVLLEDSVEAELLGALLTGGWSPAQINGRLEREGHPFPSVATLYRFVNPRPELATLLARGHSKYRRKHGIAEREKKRAELSAKRNIGTRPAVVETRERLGDWEGDTIVGIEKKERILTHVERVSGYLLASKTKDGTATEIRRATEADFRSIPSSKTHTITLDNGMEFAEWELTEQHVRAMIYFANPYHSWERGTSENTNGLLRRFFPKKTPLAMLGSTQLSEAVLKINHRPRKRLGWKTPHEIFYGVEVLQFG